MMRAVLAIALVLVAATPALPQQDKSSASYMLRYCRGVVNNEAPAQPLDAVMQGMCVGIIDGINFMMSEFPPEQKQYSTCPPANVPLDQTVRAVIAYIEARPKRLHENFKTLAMEAIHDAWPCGTN
jgi:hypothetical protein